MTAQEDFRKGIDHFKKREYTDALSRFNKILDESYHLGDNRKELPNIKILKYNYSLVLIRLGQYRDALNILEELSKEKETAMNILIDFQRGYVLGLLGCYVEAEQSFVNSINLYDKYKDLENIENYNFSRNDALRQQLFCFFRSKKESDNYHIIKEKEKRIQIMVGQNAHTTNIDEKLLLDLNRAGSELSNLIREKYECEIERKFNALIDSNRELQNFSHYYNTYAYILNSFQDYDCSISISDDVLGISGNKNKDTNKFSNPTHNMPAALRNKSYSLFSLHEYESALYTVENAISVDPENPTAWNYKGTIILNKFIYDQKPPAKTSVKRSQGDIRQILSESMRAFDESIRLFRIRGNINPLSNHDYVPLNNKGVVAIFLKEYGYAVECFKGAICSYANQQARRLENEKLTNPSSGKKTSIETETNRNSNTHTDKNRRIFPSAYNNLAYTYMRHLRKDLVHNKPLIKSLLITARETLEERLVGDPGIASLRIVLSQTFFNLGYWYALEEDETDPEKSSENIEESIKNFGYSIRHLEVLEGLTENERNDPYILVTKANTYRHRGFMYLKYLKYNREKALDQIEKAFNDFKKSIILCSEQANGERDYQSNYLQFAYIWNSIGYFILKLVETIPEMQARIVENFDAFTIELESRVSPEALSYYHKRFVINEQHRKESLLDNIEPSLDNIGNIIEKSNDQFLKKNYEFVKRKLQLTIRSVKCFCQSKVIDDSISFAYYNTAYALFRIIVEVDALEAKLDKISSVKVLSSSHKKAIIDIVIAELEQSIHHRQDFARAWLSLAIALAYSERYSEAISAIDKAIENQKRVDPPLFVEKSDIDLVYMSYIKGVILHKLGRYAEAIEHLSLASDKYDDSSKKRKETGRELIDLRLPLSIGYSEVALRRFNDSITSFKAILNLSAEKSEELEEELKKWYQISARIGLAQAYYQLGEYDGALKELSYIKDVDKLEEINKGFYYYIRGLSLDANRAHISALDAYKEAAKCSNAFIKSRALYYQGVLLQKTNRAEARLKFMEAAQADPNFSSAIQASANLRGEGVYPLEYNPMKKERKEGQDKSTQKPFLDKAANILKNLWRRVSTPGFHQFVTYVFAFLAFAISLAFGIFHIMTNYQKAVIDVGASAQFVAVMLGFVAIIAVFPMLSKASLSKLKIGPAGFEIEQFKRTDDDTFLVQQSNTEVSNMMELLPTTVPLDVPLEQYRTPIHRIAVPIRTPLRNLDMPSHYPLSHMPIISDK